MRKSEELKLRATFLKLQYQKLIEKYERHKKKEAFIKKHHKKILSLSMQGWPRTKEMKDYIKWLDIIFEAKLKGIYSLGTSNCDVIAQLNRYSKEFNQ